MKFDWITFIEFIEIQVHYFEFFNDEIIKKIKNSFNINTLIVKFSMKSEYMGHVKKINILIGYLNTGYIFLVPLYKLER